MSFGILVLLCFAFSCQALTLSTFLTPADKERYKARLLTAPHDDFEILAKSVAGLSILGVAVPEPEVSLVVSC